MVQTGQRRTRTRTTTHGSRGGLAVEVKAMSTTSLKRHARIGDVSARLGANHLAGMRVMEVATAELAPGVLRVAVRISPAPVHKGYFVAEDHSGLVKAMAMTAGWLITFSICSPTIGTHAALAVPPVARRCYLPPHRRHSALAQGRAQEEPWPRAAASSMARRTQP